jgi:hypothetical protein
VSGAACPLVSGVPPVAPLVPPDVSGVVAVVEVVEVWSPVVDVVLEPSSVLVGIVRSGTVGGDSLVMSLPPHADTPSASTATVAVTARRMR